MGEVGVMLYDADKVIIKVDTLDRIIIGKQFIQQTTCARHLFC